MTGVYRSLYEGEYCTFTMPSCASFSRVAVSSPIGIGIIPCFSISKRFLARSSSGAARGIGMEREASPTRKMRVFFCGSIVRLRWTG